MDTSPEETFMNLAIQEAQIAKAGGDFPFGAVITHHGKVIASGHAENNAKGDATAHAEMQALRKACTLLGTHNLRDCTIYSTHEPCIMCAAAIFQAKIPKVFFGATREDLPWLMRARKVRIDDLAKDSNFSIQIVQGILKDKVLELFVDLEAKFSSNQERLQKLK
ncbi:MAG: nucleoside deaminase [Patescibacteria group bacterium]|jgi:tRNA(adenine34) deaminase